MQNKVPIPAPNEVLNDRKEDIKLEEKKKTQAEIEQEMATLQYTNPQLLEVSSLGDSRCSEKGGVTMDMLMRRRDGLSDGYDKHHSSYCYSRSWLLTRSVKQ